MRDKTTYRDYAWFLLGIVAGIMTLQLILIGLHGWGVI